MYQIWIPGLEKAIVWGGLKEQYVIKMTYFQNSLNNLLEWEIYLTEAQF